MSLYSKRFKEISSIYVKNGEVIKDRHGLTKERKGIENAMEEFKDIIIEKNGILHCFFKKEKEYLIIEAIDIVRQMGKNIKDLVIIYKENVCN